MSGASDYTSLAALNWMAGAPSSMAATPSARWMGLFTAAPTDAGTGGTEVSGGSYARQQVAGALTTNGTTAAGNATLHFASVPAWIVAGMTIYDITTPASIAAGTTVLSTTGTTVVMSANAAGSGVGGTDSIQFTAFSAASGSTPSQLTTSASLQFVQATTPGWGTVIFFGLFDAVSSGNYIIGDFLGNFSWLPFEIPTASNLATVKANGYSSNDPVVFTAEYGGTLPSLSTGTMTGYTVNFVATPATDTINIDTTSGPATPIVTTSSGSGMVRKITQQPIAANVQASFSAGQIVCTMA